LHCGIYAMADNRILVTKAALQENDQADWNAFIQLLALTDYDELAPQQRAAHLVFWYESEVQNGGHLQYFTNNSYERSEEALRSLVELGAGGHARVLEQALTRWRSAARLRPADAMEYVAVALEAEFDDLDTAFHNCEVTLMQVLQRHFVEHEGNFIVRE
jgi:hypothetical protein